MRILLKQSLLILLFISISSLAFDATAQTRSKINDDSDYEPEMTLRDRLFAGIYLNSPNVIGTSNGSQFNIGLQPFVGYKFNKYIASGLALKFDYLYFWAPGVTESFSDFSTTIFTRGTIAERLILQVEGGLYSNQSFFGSEKVRNNFPVVYAGVGYSFGTSELLLSYEVTGNLGFYRIPFEYKIGFIFDF